MERGIVSWLAARLRGAKEWLAAVTTVLVAMVTLVALLKDNLHLLLVACTVFLVIAAGALAAYVALARIESALVGGGRTFRYKRYRLVAIAFLIALGIAIAGLASWSRAREYILSTAFDVRWATLTKRQVDVAQLEIGIDGTEVAIDVTIRNSLKEAVLVKRVAVSGIDAYGVGMCCCPEPTMFKINDKFRLLQRERPFSLAGQLRAKDDQYVRPVRARLVDDNCSSRSFSVMFDTSVVIAAGEYSSIRIVVPRSLDLRFGSKQYPPLRVGSLKHILVQCVLDRPNSVLAAWTGPMPPNATEVATDDDWQMIEALDAMVRR